MHAPTNAVLNAMLNVVLGGLYEHCSAHRSTQQSLSFSPSFAAQRQQLSLEKFLGTNSVLSVATAATATGGRAVHGRLGDMFPVQLRSRRRFKRGREGVWYVMAKPREVEEYRQQLAVHVQRLKQRLAWLCSGPERVFGYVTHRRVFFAIDTSGSMFESMAFLRATVAELLQRVVLSGCDAFGLACFNENVNALARCLLDVDSDTIGAALTWLGQQEAAGGTRLEPVLELCLSELHDVDAVYLVSDGLTEESTRHLMSRVAEWRAVRPVQVNTVSFNCTDVTTNRFLKSLAESTSGDFRLFQQATRERDEVIEAEDVQLLAKEVAKGERCLLEAQELQQRILDSLDCNGTARQAAETKVCGQGGCLKRWMEMKRERESTELELSVRDRISVSG